MKNFLATFEFICGEYGQIFIRIFTALNQKKAENKIERYLQTYYENNEVEREEDTWYYFSGEVVIEYQGCEEIKNPIDLIQKLQA